ncbi:helix-turn-helix domain-containing protein [Streptomyces sp. MUM 16J]|uniref:helix-turn-helix domain-containing protein n=1 Tax=Streptomyces sp. MUM 16J TaxID=2791988 RepID=UPI001F0383B6|nr:helix-turn-helix domain-containing protein [Streptomyces sp. MUM 16J]MCH0555793.1 helix-turn-helix domain-containing protein [Streptomyces sp. MUM 16J]
MEPKPWRDRVREEEELLARLNRLTSEAAARRAEALLEGVEELGSKAEVARALDRSWQAVDQAIKRYERKRASGPDATTTA